MRAPHWLLYAALIVLQVGSFSSHLAPPLRDSPRMRFFWDTEEKKPEPLQPPQLSDVEAKDRFGVQLPTYDSIQGGSYEIRQYQTMTVVECNYVQRYDG